MKPMYMSPRLKAENIVYGFKEAVGHDALNPEEYEPLKELAVQLTQEHYGDRVPVDPDVTSLTKELSILKRLMVSKEMFPFTRNILINSGYNVTEPVNLSKEEVDKLLRELKVSFANLPIEVNHRYTDGAKDIMVTELVRELYSDIFIAIDGYLSTIM